MNEQQRFTLFLNGKITAVTALSVSQPDSGFGRSDDISRLPRLHAGKKDSPSYFPVSSFLGALRHSAAAYIAPWVNRDGDTRYMLDDLYMLAQGYDTTDAVNLEASNGSITEEGGLRDINPLLSLFGRWKLPANFKPADWMPLSDDCVSIDNKGVRTEMFSRNDQLTDSIKDSEKERLVSILSGDSKITKDVAIKKSAIKALNKEIYGESDKKKVDLLKKQVLALEVEIDELRNGKAGGINTIQRPLPGSECFIAGTEFQSKNSLFTVNKLEVGLFIHILAHFSESPFVGSRSKNKGMIEGEFDVSMRKAGSRKATVIGTIKFSADEFSLVDAEGETLLSECDELWESVKENIDEHGLNFGRFLH